MSLWFARTKLCLKLMTAIFCICAKYDMFKSVYCDTICNIALCVNNLRILAKGTINIRTSKHTNKISCTQFNYQNKKFRL